MSKDERDPSWFDGLTTSGWLITRADKPNVGEGLQTLAQNPRRGLKTPTYKVTGLLSMSKGERGPLMVSVPFFRNATLLDDKKPVC
jgi:hypothetical protein